jgi:hypothetical protein
VKPFVQGIDHVRLHAGLPFTASSLLRRRPAKWVDRAA